MNDAATITTVTADGRTGTRMLGPASLPGRPDGPLRSRVAYAAAHVVPRVAGDNVPGAPADLDWDATLAFRHHLWSWGLGVADAMDTAQRNMGLDAAAVRELVRRSAEAARSVGGDLVVGVGTDHVDEPVLGLAEIVTAYLEQLHHAEDQGAAPVLMASRHLARAATCAADYEHVYREVLSRAGGPVVLHWLGAVFDPQLAGYFGPPAERTGTVLRIVGEHADRVRGIKMSLLDADLEVQVREQLPDGVRMFTGDDFHYVGLIEGDGARHSDALLGALAVVAPQASAAISALDRGDVAGYRRALGPTEALARRVFAAPTPYYKTGVAFLSWLNGHQPAFAMVGGLHAARSLPHLSSLVELADAAGALEDPERAAGRWNDLLALHGIRARQVVA